MTVYVQRVWGLWACIPPSGVPEPHDARHDAIQSAILWAYAHRPARAVLHSDGVDRLICSYGSEGPADVFDA